MSNPFLSSLGVPQLDQARSPTVKGFPTGMNANNISEWTQAIHELIPCGEALRDWGIAIRNYVRLCEQHGVFPFSNTSVDRNDEIASIFKMAREDFVRFVNKNKFFHNVAIRSTHRQVHLTENGFVLRVYAKARIDDPSFIQWIEHLPMPFNFPTTQPLAPNRYVKQLTHYLTVFVENDALGLPERWLVGYEISVPMFPTLPNEMLPSREEIETFVLDVLWLPLLRSMRPIGMGHRLI
jgi:hypothetical protein